MPTTSDQEIDNLDSSTWMSDDTEFYGEWCSKCNIEGPTPLQGLDLEVDRLRKVLMLILEPQSPKSSILDLTGHIERGRWVGGGRYGDVYLSSLINIPSSVHTIHQVLPVVAIKAFKIQLARDRKTRSVKLSKREQDIWYKLQHPNIMPLIAIAYLENDENQPCCVSPWLPGGNLEEYMGSQSLASRYSLMLGVGNGLRYLHHNEIIHGDMKPVNVLIDGKGNPRVCDFGLSRAFYHDVTSATHVGGTVRWMPPEYISDTSITKATFTGDVYSFSLICYELIAECLPFCNYRMEGQIIMAVAGGERPQRPTNPCMPDWIWNLCNACWSVTPPKRPTMCDIYAELRKSILLPPLLSSIPTGVAKEDCHVLQKTITARASRRKALIISIIYNNQPEYYRGEKEFKGTGDDHETAISLQNLLQHKWGYLPQDIDTLFEEEATRSNIIAALRDLVRDAQEDDAFVLYFSGLGSNVGSTDPYEEDGMDEVIFPYDYSETMETIVDNEMNSILVQPLLDIKCHLTAIFDCCHSGTMMDLPDYEYHMDAASVSDDEAIMPKRVMRNLPDYECHMDATSVPDGEAIGPKLMMRSDSVQFKLREAAPLYLRYSRHDQIKARVISWSACRDQELSWVYDGLSMGSCLINILERCDRISFRDLLKELAETMHKMDLGRKTKWDFGRDGPFVKQHPQLSSLTQLDLDDPVIL